MDFFKGSFPCVLWMGVENHTFSFVLVKFLHGRRNERDTTVHLDHGHQLLGTVA